MHTTRAVRRFAATLAVWAIAGAGAASADRQPADRVRIEVGACALEAPAALRVQLEDLAERAASILPRIESSLGVRPAASYRILLIPPGRSDDREIAALDASAPPWATGFMQPWRRVGGIRVASADRYPYSDLASVLTHEATHMLLFDATRGALPRWFEEGVASGLERSWGLRDMAVWSSSLLTGQLPELADLDVAFESSEGRARAAYAASFDFMTWTVRRHGAGVVRDIVREAAARPFPAAWEAATGEALAQSESEWRRSSVLLYRWIPALTGTGALWAGITVLALAAGARRRARSRAIRERWEAEEGLRPAASPIVRDLEFFQGIYEDGTPPWDIGRPQPEVVRLAERGEIRGSVLDIGCGTGENALHLAGLGHEVWGIDGAPLAIERALGKARERGVEATFLVGDALDLGSLGRTFDTVIDSGLFHVFPDEDRPRFVRGLAAVVRPGGRYVLICFSESEPGTEGPRRVTQGEIRSAFGRGWRVEQIREARFETNRESGDARAWLATITRI